MRQILSELKERQECRSVPLRPVLSDQVLNVLQVTNCLTSALRSTGRRMFSFPPSKIIYGDLMYLIANKASQPLINNNNEDKLANTS